MTALPEDQPLPLEEGDDQRMAKPPRGSADDGKTGGQSQGGRIPMGPSTAGDGAGTAGTNAVRGGAAGSEDERTAPGMSTEKKADDTKPR